MALILPVLILLVGGTVDYVSVLQVREQAQQTADAASLAGAKSLSLSDSNKSSVESIVEGIVNSYSIGGAGRATGRVYKATTDIIDDAESPLQVEVTINTQFKSHFGSQFGLGDINIQVQSVAIVVGKPNICLLALEPSANGAIDLNHQAKVVGQNCAVFSNSNHSIGIKSKNDAVLTATEICSAGGVQGGGKNFSPPPLKDCPQFTDPLAGRPEPPVGPCTQTNLKLFNQTATLPPGTYCGGISISGTSKVTFQPGIFVIKDGLLDVAGSGEISGADVGFFFAGKSGAFSFGTNSVIDLAAQKSGDMAGLLFFGSRSQNGTLYTINSDHAHQLLGTIYLPQGSLVIDANQPIADLSAYTAIVARKVTAYSGPTVMLNTNYGATDIPVPDGIRGAGMPVRLAR
jgi:Putative Flp pilus-assembly TadE/G-like